MSMAFNKPVWRQNNLSWMKKHPEIWRKNKLRAKYMELLGETGHEMYSMMVEEKCLPDPSYFIGVDNDPSIIFGHMLRMNKQKKDQFALRLGNIFEEANLAVAHDSVSVLNFDFTEKAVPPWWEANGVAVRNIIQANVDKGNPFVLILNHSIDQLRRGDADLLREHARLISLFVTPSGWTFDLGAFTKGLEKVDGGFLGQAGGFEVYRSGDRAWRMATARFAYGRKSRHVRFDVGQ